MPPYDVYEFPLGAGVDTKTDERSVAPPRVLELVNADLTRTGSIRTRRGFHALPTACTDGSEVTTGARLAVAGDSLYLVTGAQIRAWSESESAWGVTSGTETDADPSPTNVTNVQATRSVVARGTQGQRDPAIAMIGSLACVAWIEVAESADTTWPVYTSMYGKLQVRVTDVSTGAVVVRDWNWGPTRPSFYETMPRVLAVSDRYFVIVYAETVPATAGRIIRTSIDTQDLSTAPVTTYLRTDAWGSEAAVVAPIFDACVDGATIRILYARNPTPSFYEHQYSVPAFAQLSTKSIGGSAPNNYSGCAIVARDDGRWAVAYTDVVGTNTLFMTQFSAADVQTGTISINPLNGGRQVLLGLDASENVILMWDDTTDIPYGTTRIGYDWTATTPAVVLAQGTMRNSYPRSRPTMMPDGTTLVALMSTYNNGATVSLIPVTPTYTLVDLRADMGMLAFSTSNERPLAALAVGYAPPTQPCNAATSIAFHDGVGYAPISVTTEQVRTPVTATPPYTAESFTLTGIDMARYEQDAPTLYQPAVMADDLYLASGQMTVTSAWSTVEVGYSAPPVIYVANTADTGGDIAKGVYTFSAVFRWLGPDGTAHRSAPAVYATADLSASATDTNTITMQLWSGVVPSLRLTGVCVDWYRTLVDVAEPLYRIGSVYPLPGNVLAQDYNRTDSPITFTTGASDDEISVEPRLYTTGGVLEDVTPAASTCLVAWRDRLAAVVDDGRTVLVSKPLTPGYAVEWSDGIAIRMDSVPKVTALAVLDDRLLMFTERECYVVGGEAADARGLNDRLSLVQRVSSDLGCKDWRSVATYDGGVFFASPGDGTRPGEICVMGRDLAVRHLGDPVGAYLEDFPEVTGAAMDDAHERVLFTVRNSTGDDGRVLVYYHRIDAWCVYEVQDGLGSTIAPVSVAIYRGLPHLLTADGRVWREQEDSWADVSTTGATRHADLVQKRVKLSWTNPYGKQRTMRVRGATVLGEQLAPCALSVVVRYDFDEAEEAHTWTGDNLGATVPSRLQRMAHFVKQKCQSVTLTISDAADSEAEDLGATGEGAALASVVFEAMPTGTGTYGRTLTAGKRG